MNKMNKYQAFKLVALMLVFGITTNIPAESAGRKNKQFGMNGKLISNNVTVFYNDIGFSGGVFLAAGGNGSDFYYNSYITGEQSPDQGTIDFGNTEVAYAVATKPTGSFNNQKFIVVGDTNNGGSTSIAVAKLKRDDLGTYLDTSFSSDGKVTTTIANRSVVAFGVAIDSQDRIIVCGRILGGANTDAVFVRYTDFGTLDTTFGNNGIAIIDDNGASNLALSVAIEFGSNKIIAGGLSGNDFALYRLNNNGTLDTTFAGDGIAETPMSGSSRINSITLQTVPNKIFVGGSANGNTNAAFAKYNSDGTLDTTFGNSGKLIVDNFPTGTEAVTKLIVDFPLSNPIIYASLNTTDGGTGAMKLDQNGVIDYGFGTGGYTRHTEDGTSCSSILYNFDDKTLYLTTNDSVTQKGSIVSLATTPAPSAANDFDGDGFADSVIFRPSTATWFIYRSSDQTVEFRGFGVNGDVPIDGDFDGDGKADTAIYRPSVSQWWFARSSDGSTFATTFGSSGDKPVAADYDKDGKTDIAIWRPSTGNYLVARSSQNFATFYGYAFGSNGDIPVGTAVFP